MSRVPKTLPIFLFSGDQDPVGDKGKGPTAVADQYRRLGVGDVTLKLWPQGRHEMLNETNRDEVMDSVVDWLDAHLPPDRSPRRSCRERGHGSVLGVMAARMADTDRGGTMAKYLLLKHYTGGPERTAQGCIPMDQWTPQEITDHISFMHHVAATLAERGEFVSADGLSPEGTFVRFDGAGRPPVTDGPFAETKDLIAGWMIIDVDSQ